MSREPFAGAGERRRRDDTTHGAPAGTGIRLRAGVRTRGTTGVGPRRVVHRGGTVARGISRRSGPRSETGGGTRPRSHRTPPVPVGFGVGVRRNPVGRRGHGGVVPRSAGGDGCREGRAPPRRDGDVHGRATAGRGGRVRAGGGVGGRGAWARPRRRNLCGELTGEHVRHGPVGTTVHGDGRVGDARHWSRRDRRLERVGDGRVDSDVPRPNHTRPLQRQPRDGRLVGRLRRAPTAGSRHHRLRDDPRARSGGNVVAGADDGDRHLDGPVRGGEHGAPPRPDRSVSRNRRIEPSLELAVGPRGRARTQDDTTTTEPPTAASRSDRTG